MTSIWPTLSTTQNPPRSRAQTSTRSRNPRITRSPEIPTTAEIFIQNRNRHPLAHSLATRMVEVTSAMGTAAATHPGLGPGHQQEAVAVEAAITPVMTAMETLTEEGIDPTQVDIIMAETATPTMATLTATW